MTTLSDLYDADHARKDPVVASLRAKVSIPHPLHEVQYSDGILRDTTAGRVRTLPWLRLVSRWVEVDHGSE